MALRRRFALAVLTGAIVLTSACLSMVVRTASATDLCTQFDITGTWSFSVPGHSYTAIFHQDSVGMLTGELVYTAADVAEFGYPPGATFPITSGQMSGTHLTFEDTPTMGKTDGTGAHVGVYSGTVTETGVGTGSVAGEAQDKQVPSSHASFQGNGPAACLATAPAPPAIAPSPSGFNQPVTVSATPGADTEVSSPPLGNASQASATVNGATRTDLLALVELGPFSAHDCYISFVRALSMLTKDMIDAGIASFLPQLATCLIVADEIDELDRGELTAVDASASTCGEVQLRVSSSGAGHQIVHVTHAGALPGETVRVTCTFSHGQAAITVAARKRGTPLRALIGKRLQIGFLRSGADQLGGRVTVRFARH